MSNLLEGFLIFGFAFGLLFAIVYFGFVKPFKENMEKSGETWKDLIEKSERHKSAEKDLETNITIFFLYNWFNILLSRYLRIKKKIKIKYNTPRVGLEPTTF